MKKTILIVGESGSGKSYLCSALAKYGLKTLASYTTRSPRCPNEQGHIFISKEQFDQLPDKVATTYFAGHYYCATRQQVDNSDLYIIDVEGIKTLKANYSGEKNLCVVCLKTPEDVRYERMIQRGDSENDAKSRIAHDRDAFSDVLPLCDVVLDATKPVEELTQSILRIIA